ncbi:ABC transporter permease [Solirubrobacter sp. CPCC 204708]|uniref:ABC transporter permease n=1 Tax=Solirubrobacter deserti TaxID=2282478 RepID=A0ABT4RC78_9ACTN|nr:ABC transporter permease [Solirubrobacter deserti]MBE2315497.1 ABC transporter permease [Solirubrobacter deserti]MDA0136136.1 ABC transporter permease [Solirubrobacter deserti]
MRRWALFAAPGMAWLAAFFLVAFYAVVAVGFGNVTDVYDPVPHWNPLEWNVGYMLQALEDIAPGGRTWPVFVRTLLYVAIAVALSLAIGYPVAYYVSRYAHGRMKALLLILLAAPFWISYLMRMFAWTNLLADGGYAATVLNALSLDALLLDGEDWLGGQHVAVVMGLVYGYVPYLILPLYASLDRIDERLIEAARDLGASSAGAFRRVVLPLSRAGTLGGIVLIALPMFGDYYTPDLMSGSPRTAMLGNTINNSVQGGPDKALGAALTLLLSAFLLVFMLYYLRELRRENAL